MALPHRLAALLRRDSTLPDLVASLAEPVEFLPLADLASGFVELVDFEPEVMLVDGLPNAETVGALAVLRSSAPQCAIVVAVDPADDLRASALARRLAARVVPAPLDATALLGLLARARAPLEVVGPELFEDLVAGLADELNNPVLAALGNVQLLGATAAHDAVTQGYATAATHALERAQAVLDRMRALTRSRDVAGTLPRTDLAVVLADELRRLPQADRDRIRVRRLTSVEVAVPAAELAEILGPLLSCALALTGPSRRLGLRLWRGRRSSRLDLRFALGVGVGLRVAELFRPYHVQRALRGSPHGLTLFLAHGRLRSYGGTATARRRSDGSLEMRFRVPRSDVGLNQRDGAAR
ncbi:MAG: histidine kinase dimerization/phospho-acceptor domain-containing protein [Planctomycetota bacterium]